jgi:N-acetylglucosamine-6-sulfatase
VTLTDLAPTILDIAGIQGFERLDGRSFLPTLHGRSQTWRDTQLVQTGSRARRTFTSGWGYRGVRTSRYTYGIQPDTGFELLLDRKLNPYQRENHASDSAYGSVLTELRHRTSLLRSCTGVTCSVRFGPVPALTTRAHAVGAR